MSVRRVFSLFLWLALSGATSDVYAEPIITLGNGSRYELLQILGKGSFGQVYRAKEAGSPEGTRTVAIKLFRSLDDFKAERAAPAHRLMDLRGGDHIIAIRDADEVAAVRGSFGLLSMSGAIVMDEVDGNLAGILDRFQLGFRDGSMARMSRESFLETSGRIADTTHQLARLWAVTARKKVIHSDIKPENLGYTENPFRLKLLDLGSLRDGPIQNHDDVNVLSTPGYSAPEVRDLYNGELKEPYNNFSDLYSIGVTLRDLICGGCDLPTLRSLIVRIAADLPRDEASARAIASLWIAYDFSNAATQAKPRDRYRMLAKGEGPRLFRFAPSERGGSKNYASLSPYVHPYKKVEASYVPKVWARVDAHPKFRIPSPPVFSESAVSDCQRVIHIIRYSGVD